MYFLLAKTQKNPEIVDVQFIKPINQIETLGNIPSSLISEIKDKCGDDVTFEISDYEVTYDNGVYGLEVDLVVDNRHAEVPKEQKFAMAYTYSCWCINRFINIILVIIKLFKKNVKSINIQNKLTLLICGLTSKPSDLSFRFTTKNG